MNIQKKYCGHITIIGKANVGKSTLINQIVGKKISIVSRKKNTTKNHIIGVNTKESYQGIYIDTPGIIFDKKGNEIIYKKNYFYEIIKNSALIMLIIDKLFWTEKDENILYKIKKIKVPIIIGINKIDKIKNKNILLPFIDFLKTKNIFREIVPISAKKIKNIILLNKIIQSYLPNQNHIYPSDYITENSHFFTISEIIREKLIFFISDELPSIVQVQIEDLRKTNKELYIRAIILVKNTRQKKMIIGKNGEKIKKISITSRCNIEKEFFIKTHLSLWVTVTLKTNKYINNQQPKIANFF